VDVDLILAELAERRPVFHSEADFQHELAWKLRNTYEVRLERPYASFLNNFDERQYLDICAQEENDFYAFELKYKTKEWQGDFKGEKFFLIGQGAYQNARYDFWKEGKNYKAGYSYAYLGWMFDLLDKPYLPPIDINTFPSLAAAVAMFPFVAPSEGLVPQQIGAAIDAVFNTAIDRMGASNVGPYGIEILRIAGSDLEVIPGVGNGGGDTIYRLKEGNERFMITDVNNPQTSAMAQSSLFAMCDLFGNYGEAIAYFNHVPGGCNVLFMDGHVDWIPYVAPAPGTVGTASMDLGATQPVLPSMANIIGLFAMAND